MFTKQFYHKYDDKLKIFRGVWNQKMRFLVEKRREMEFTSTNLRGFGLQIVVGIDKFDKCKTSLYLSYILISDFFPAISSYF